MQIMKFSLYCHCDLTPKMVSLYHAGNNVATSNCSLLCNLTRRCINAGCPTRCCHPLYVFHLSTEFCISGAESVQQLDHNQLRHVTKRPGWHLSIRTKTYRHHLFSSDKPTNLGASLVSKSGGSDLYLLDNCNTGIGPFMPKFLITAVETPSLNALSVPGASTARSSIERFSLFWRAGVTLRALCGLFRL